MVNQEYLPDSYQFDTGKLIEPIRLASILRSLGIKISTPMELKDYETEIITISDDIKISISAEPLVGIRSTNKIVTAKKRSSVIQGNVSYGYLELQRVNDSVLPFDDRAMLVAARLAEYEEALSFAKTLTGLDDSDIKPFGNGVANAYQGATQVTTLSTASFTLAISGLRKEIAVLAARYGSLKNRPLVLVMNNAAYSELMAVASGLSDDHDVFHYLEETLIKHGGAGSGWAIVKDLGCTITEEDEVMSIAPETDPVLMLMLVDSNFQEVFASPIGALSDGVKQESGLNVDIIERWLPYVHDILANKIIYDASP